MIDPLYATIFEGLPFARVNPDVPGLYVHDGNDCVGIALFYDPQPPMIRGHWELRFVPMEWLRAGCRK